MLLSDKTLGAFFAEHIKIGERTARLARGIYGAPRRPLRIT
jgi:hypothetical protein